MLFYLMYNLKKSKEMTIIKSNTARTYKNGKLVKEVDEYGKVLFPKKAAKKPKTAPKK